MATEDGRPNLIRTTDRHVKRSQSDASQLRPASAFAKAIAAALRLCKAERLGYGRHEQDTSGSRGPTPKSLLLRLGGEAQRTDHATTGARFRGRTMESTPPIEPPVETADRQPGSCFADPFTP